MRLTLHHHGLPVEVRYATRGTDRKTADDLEGHNAKRKVPTLILDGDVHTEIVAILDHLDRTHVQRTEAQRRAHLRWCSYVATELHQAVLGPIFDPRTPQAARDDAQQRLLPPLLEHLEQAVGEGPLVREEPGGADFCLLWAVLLLQLLDAEAVGPRLSAWARATRGLPGVRELLRAERERAA